MPKLLSLDHLVLTVRSLAETITFYQDALGMTAEQFTGTDGTERVALKFGGQKINLHQAGHEFEPKAFIPTPGSADLCFLTQTPIDDWQRHLGSKSIPIEDGPIARTGAMGPILSIYIRDPDRNLIEIGQVI